MEDVDLQKEFAKPQATVVAQADVAPVRFGSSTSYYNELRKVKADLQGISALDMKISPDQPNPVVQFMQMGLNALYKNKAAGEDGIASEAFVARVNLFIKEHAKELTPVSNAKEIDGKVLAALIKRHESDMFGHKDGMLGSERDIVNRALFEALNSIDNTGIKGRGARFNPYPSKPVEGAVKVGQTGMSYDGQSNALTI
jgi:hypothetical protein